MSPSKLLYLFVPSVNSTCNVQFLGDQGSIQFAVGFRTLLDSFAQLPSGPQQISCNQLLTLKTQSQTSEMFMVQLQTVQTTLQTDRTIKLSQMQSEFTVIKSSQRLLWGSENSNYSVFDLSGNEISLLMQQSEICFLLNFTFQKENGEIILRITSSNAPTKWTPQNADSVQFFVVEGDFQLKVSAQNQFTVSQSLHQLGEAGFLADGFELVLNKSSFAKTKRGALYFIQNSVSQVVTVKKQFLISGSDFMDFVDQSGELLATADLTATLAIDAATTGNKQFDCYLNGKYNSTSTGYKCVASMMKGDTLVAFTYNTLNQISGLWSVTSKLVGADLTLLRDGEFSLKTGTEFKMEAKFTTDQLVDGLMMQSFIQTSDQSTCNVKYYINNVVAATNYVSEYANFQHKLIDSITAVSTCNCQILYAIRDLYQNKNTVTLNFTSTSAKYEVLIMSTGSVLEQTLLVKNSSFLQINVSVNVQPLILFGQNQFIGLNPAQNKLTSTLNNTIMVTTVKSQTQSITLSLINIFSLTDSRALNAVPNVLYIFKVIPTLNYSVFKLSNGFSCLVTTVFDTFPVDCLQNSNYFLQQNELVFYLYVQSLSQMSLTVKVRFAKEVSEASMLNPNELSVIPKVIQKQMQIMGKDYEIGFDQDFEQVENSSIVGSGLMLKKVNVEFLLFILKRGTANILFIDFNASNLKRYELIQTEQIYLVKVDQVASVQFCNSTGNISTSYGSTYVNQTVKLINTIKDETSYYLKVTPNQKALVKLATVFIEITNKTVQRVNETFYEVNRPVGYFDTIFEFGVYNLNSTCGISTNLINATIVNSTANIIGIDFSEIQITSFRVRIALIIDGNPIAESWYDDVVI